jgi:hypothetical protein
MSGERSVAESGRTVRGRRRWNEVMFEYRGDVVCLAEMARRSGFPVKTIYRWRSLGWLERGYVELREHLRDLRKKASELGIPRGTLAMRLLRGGDPLAPVRRRGRRAA